MEKISLSSDKKVSGVEKVLAIIKVVGEQRVMGANKILGQDWDVYFSRTYSITLFLSMLLVLPT